MLFSLAALSLLPGLAFGRAAPPGVHVVHLRDEDAAPTLLIMDSLRARHASALAEGGEDTADKLREHSFLDFFLVGLSLAPSSPSVCCGYIHGSTLSHVSNYHHFFFVHMGFGLLSTFSILFFSFFFPTFFCSR
jgi:hypothetical protein